MIKGIVFDKDGTLTDFDKTWMPAIHKAVDVVAKDDKDLKHELMVAGGWDPEENRIQSGSIFGAGDLNDLLDCCLEMLPHLSDDRESLEQELLEIYEAVPVDGAVPVTNLQEFFGLLHSRGITIGVATMDSEEAAHKLFDKFGVSDQLDFVVGYDSGKGVKPSGGMVQAFMEHTGIPASEIMVVGDNAHDTDMGKNAGVAVVVGVLTGNSLRQDLEGHADYILESIEALPELLDSLKAS